jgi:glycosyltransferase involved in cell wall biosynthesis
MMKQPLVSVVIPTFNRSRLVCEALESVLSQTLRRLEVIVVDDGSTDDTAEQIGALSDSRIKYVRRPHGGVAAARNAGIAVAAAPLVSFLDSDDLWKAPKLEREVAFLDGNGDVDVLFSDLEKTDGSIHVSSFMRTTPVFSHVLEGSSFAGGGRVPRAAMLACLLEEVPIKPTALTIRRNTFSRAGTFNERWTSSEDWELLLRLAKCAQFAYLDEPLAILRVQSSALHRSDAENGDRAMLALLRREATTLDDPWARAAARRGIGAVSNHLALVCLARGRRRAAVSACLRGAVDSRDVTLIFRGIGVYLPAVLRRQMVRFFRRIVR